MSKYLSELKAIQRQYADLITSFDFSQVDDSFYYKAVDLIEKCEQFWTCKSEQLSITLNDLTSCSRCYVLEGAVYLDVKNQGQYEFVTLGDYHFLNDPFVKMRHFFGLGKSAVTDHCREYFIDAYNDTVSILKDYSEYLFFISLKVLCARQFDEDIATGEKVYWDIISDALGKEYRSLDDLGADYHTIDEIENVMRPEVNKYFIFSGRSDANLSQEIDTMQIDTEIANYEKKLKEVIANKTRLEHEIDTMPMEATHRERKIADMTKRLDLLYDTISEIESCLADANLRKESIEKERVTVENIYEMLKTFGAFYDIMTEEERRDLVSYLIKEVQIYPNDEEAKIPLKSIEFNFPVYVNNEEVNKVLWEKDSSFEVMCVMQRNGVVVKNKRNL